MMEDQPNIPEELERQLVHALQDLSLYIHAAAGLSEVSLLITHDSDALAKAGSTMILVKIRGKRIKVDNPEDLAKTSDPLSNPSDMVNEVIAKSIDAAKKKQG